MSNEKLETVSNLFKLLDKLNATEASNEEAMLKRVDIIENVFETIYTNMWLLKYTYLYEIIIASFDRIKNNENYTKAIEVKVNYLYNKYYLSLKTKTKLLTFIENRCAKNIQGLWRRYWYTPYKTMLIEEEVEENGQIIKRLKEIYINRHSEYTYSEYTRYINSVNCI